MALASLALDLIYLKAVLEHLGVQFDELPEATTADPEAHSLVEKTMALHGEIEVSTDSKAAHDLVHRNSSGGGATRHVERKEFKMRELRARRICVCVVKLVRTDDMVADILTKILDRKAFERHKRTLKNLAAA